ncbi:Imm49 family immunity protein [Psychrobacter sp. JCM 18900]|uniref:Imm49 family immunity protein n=1 Tax=Psychrobacter sp. JCM 18900 TaxID=1298608 RepID=UPI00191A0D56|nr:Imm49 family immunity protein [Psychrobacter sp. JCM 18900]
MTNNYKVYLGSEAGRDYQESFEHVMGIANFIINPSENEDLSGSKRKLKIIETFEGNPLACMRGLGVYYEAKASSDLLLHADIDAFKQDAYMAAKLQMMGKEEIYWAYNGYNTNNFFIAIMSDNLDLIRFLIEHRDEVVEVNELYDRKDTRSYFNKNTLLALAGEWTALKERSLVFLEDDNKDKRDIIRIPDHEFYIALCDKNIKAMQMALTKLLEPKLAKKAAYNANTWFDFYLQIQVLLYAKIAAIHGYDLGINSPIAPKELIEFKPLSSYSQPYDFMTEFNYNQPQQDWINMWQERMRVANEKKKKKGLFSWLKK